MSLINQMLRDLDRQHGPTGAAEIGALRGLGLTGPKRRHNPRTAQRLIWLAAAAALLAMVHWSAERFLTDAPSATGTDAELTVAKPLPLPRPPADLQDRAPGPQQSPSAKAATSVPVPATPATASLEVRAEAPRARAVTPAAQPSTTVRSASAEETAARRFGQAQQALAMADYPRAQQLLAALLDAFPHHTTARRQLAALMIQEGRPGDAEAVLAAGLAVTPENVDMARLYAQLLAERGAPAAALEALEPATAGSQPDAQTLGLRAAIHERLQRYAAAARDYREALRLQPRQALWWTGLAVALEHDGKSGPALDAYRRAAQLPVENAVKVFVTERIRVLAGPETPSKG
ncbi:MAG: tetratricopeptide repeat protein [Gammaproteobacteria bacterium]|jgi:tetratricopeptide (TPR) repeat protein